MADVYDITPGLIERVDEYYRARCMANASLPRLAKKLEEGKATYDDAYKYAEAIGKARADAFAHEVSSDVLPDGRMYYNIANRLMTETLGADHEVVSAYATGVQELINQKSGINLAAQTADLDEDRIKGFVEGICNAEVYDDVAWKLGEPVVTHARTVVDDTVKKNAEFQGRAGVKATVIRNGTSKCCEWCSDLAGDYTYPNVPREVFQRHDNCKCTVDYEGRRLTAYNSGGSSRTFRDQGEQERIDARKQEAEWLVNNSKLQERERAFGRLTRFRTGNQTTEDYVVSKDKLRGFIGVDADKAVPTARREAKSWIERLSEPAKQLFERYTYNQNDSVPKFFERINSFIRDGYTGAKDYTEQVEIMSSALKESTLKHNYVCFRGSDYDPFEGVKVGERSTAHQFLSTSLASSGSFKGKYDIVVLADEGTHAAYIEELSAKEFKRQREMLFDKDVIYEVLSRQGNEIIVRTIP